MAPTPSTHTADFQPAANQPAPGQPASNHTCTSHMDKWVINLSKTPLTQEQLSLLQKGPNCAITPKYLPIEAYITSIEQVTNKLPSQEADELRSDVNRILKQVQQPHNKHCNLNPPVQGPYRTQTGPVQGGSYSRQGGGHGHHGPTGLHQQTQTLLQDTNTYKVLPKDPTSYLKTNSLPFLKTLSKQEAYPPKNTNNSTLPVQSLPSSMASQKSLKQAPP